MTSTARREGWKLSRRRAILIATLWLAQIRHSRRRRTISSSPRSGASNPRLSRTALATRRAKIRENLPRELQGKIFYSETIHVSSNLCEV